MYVLSSLRKQQINQAQLLFILSEQNRNPLRGPFRINPLFKSQISFDQFRIYYKVFTPSANTAFLFFLKTITDETKEIQFRPSYVNSKWRNCDSLMVMALKTECLTRIWTGGWWSSYVSILPSIGSVTLVIHLIPQHQFSSCLLWGRH